MFELVAFALFDEIDGQGGKMIINIKVSSCLNGQRGKMGVEGPKKMLLNVGHPRTIAAARLVKIDFVIRKIPYVG